MALVLAVAAGLAATAALAATRVDKTRLPLGDGKYLTTPKKGYVDSCIRNFQGGGAFRNGPWIDDSAKTWDMTKKISVQGAVHWNSTFSAKVVGSKRIISGNGLPSHTTGVFPVASSDPAYQYDRNPNSIQSYTLKATLTAKPKAASKPTCVGGTIGVLKDGIPVFSAFDAGGRDAAAHE